MTSLHVNPFRVVCADPPWRHRDQLPGAGRGAGKHYTTMPTRDIAALRLPPIDEDSLLAKVEALNVAIEAMRRA